MNFDDSLFLLLICSPPDFYSFFKAPLEILPSVYLLAVIY